MLLHFLQFISDPTSMHFVSSEVGLKKILYSWQMSWGLWVKGKQREGKICLYATHGLLRQIGNLKSFPWKKKKRSKVSSNSRQFGWESLGSRRVHVHYFLFLVFPLWNICSHKWELLTKSACGTKAWIIKQRRSKRSGWKKKEGLWFEEGLVS